MKILIVGRTATGKDRLAKALSERGLKIVQSYTTREKRTPDEDTHTFITNEEAASYTDRVAETVIGGTLYFATRKQVEEGDVYIVDPKGFYDVTSNMPDTAFFLMYCSADPEESLLRALERSSDPQKAEEEWKKRTEAEAEEFFDFEKEIESFASRNDFPKNCFQLYRWENDFLGQEEIDRAADNVLYCVREWRNMEKIVATLKSQPDSMFDTDDEGRIIVYNKDYTFSALPDDLFIGTVIVDAEGYKTIVSSYLRLHNI